MRCGGILMHISSLPGPYGIGSLGKPAFEFVDFLEKAKQRVWQILPLNPPGFGNSPYQSISSFSGNPFFIDLDALAEEGLLTDWDLGELKEAPQAKVDYNTLAQNRPGIWRRAFERFCGGAAFDAFLAQNRFWLEDEALFAALQKTFGQDWANWPLPLRNRHPKALEEAAQSFADEIRFYGFLQFVFWQQWQKLRKYAARKGVQIMGDLPIYLPLNAVDVWKYRHLFCLDEKGAPTEVAGFPADDFAKGGQLWGNPLFDWKQMAKEEYGWWCDRVRGVAKLYDLLRLDHFRGFESFWAVPAGQANAANGRWVPGPGMAFLAKLQEALPNYAFVVEDLGAVTRQVRQLQQQFGHPGMEVLQFCFEAGGVLPHDFKSKSVCYSGTHDNQTLAGWLATAKPEVLDKATAYLGLNPQEGAVWGMLRGGMASNSDLFVAQMQDYLGLGDSARMNTPGVVNEDNWTWRAPADYAKDALTQKIAHMTQLFGR